MAASVVQAPATVAFRDSLGERQHVPDPSGTGTLELLYLRREIASAPSVEPALRERAGQLVDFRDAQYARIHGIELRDGALALVSERIVGVRLSQLLDAAEREPLPLNINAALALLRQLVPAVAVLHQVAAGVTHGAIGPERLVVTPDGRVVIVEHALGGALEQLRFSCERYWRELRIPVPRSAGSPRFDQRTDVTQIGAVALALVLGRLLRDDDYARLGEAVSSAWATSVRGGFEPLPPGFRSWLMRALQLDPSSSFPSAMAAWSELDKIIGDSDDIAPPQALDTFLTQYHALAPAPRRGEETVAAPIAAAPPIASREIADARVSPSRALEIAPAAGLPIGDPEVADARVSPSRAVAISPAGGGAIADLKLADVRSSVMENPPGHAPVRDREIFDFHSFGAAVEDGSGADDLSGTVMDRPKPRPWARMMGLAVVSIAIASGGAMAGGRYFSSAVAAPAVTGTLAINTNPAGAQVSVDGQPRGVTPVNLALGAGAHIIELRGAGEPRSIPVTIAAGTHASQYVELQQGGASSGQLEIRTDPAGARVMLDGVPHGTSPLTLRDLAPGAHTVLLVGDVGSATHQVKIEAGVTAVLVAALTPVTGPVSGWITVAAPLSMQLYENGRLLGSSETERIMVPAGRHDIELVNLALDYRVVRSVQVAPGKVSAIAVDLPRQRLSLNAVPWAEVWIDGEKAGETPLGDVSVSVGPHEVVFRHPELGEQRQAITVTATAPARLSVDMRKK